MVNITISFSKEFYTPPTGKVLGLIERASVETGIATSTLSNIVWCESRYRFDAVNENKTDEIAWSRDYGLFQLNDYYHKATALKMGLDIHDPEQGTTYAIHLLKTQGLLPWSASKLCWES